MFIMNIKEVTNQETQLAWLAYEVLHSGMIVAYRNVFGSDLTKEELLQMVIKSKIISCQCLIDCHINLDIEKKLILLNNFIDDSDILGEFLRSIMTYGRDNVKITIGECKVLFPVILRDFPKYTDCIHFILQDKDKTKFIKSLKMPPELEDPLMAQLVINRLVE